MLTPQANSEYRMTVIYIGGVLSEIGMESFLKGWRFNDHGKAEYAVLKAAGYRPSPPILRAIVMESGRHFGASDEDRNGMCDTIMRHIVTAHGGRRSPDWFDKSRVSTIPCFWCDENVTCPKAWHPQSVGTRPKIDCVMAKSG